MNAAEIEIVVDAQDRVALVVVANATRYGWGALSVGAGESLSYDPHGQKNRRSTDFSSAEI